MRTADGFVLLKGSSIHKISADSLNNGIKKKVEQSRTSGKIKMAYFKTTNYFHALLPPLYSISDPQQWKTDQGKALKSFETEST